MQIKIWNRNSNATYNVDEGAVLTRNYNEQLDSALLKISNQTSKIDGKPFDYATITEGSFSMIMCIDYIRETQIGVNPPIFNYEISLFSCTKLLEGVILPNLSITPLKNQIKRTIGQYITRYLNEYAPKIRVGNVNNNSLQPGIYATTSYEVSPNVFVSLEEYFNKECPEMQWNTPTLREVINDLMMVQDCIPVLEGRELKWINISKTKNAVALNTTNTIYVNKSHSSEDYVSELQMQMVNVMDENNNTTTTEIMPFVSNGDWILNSDNTIIKTQHPILSVKHLWLHQMISSNVGGQQGSIDLNTVRVSAGSGSTTTTVQKGISFNNGNRTMQVALNPGETISNVSVSTNSSEEGAYAQLVAYNSSTGEITYAGGCAILSRQIQVQITYTINGVEQATNNKLFYLNEGSQETISGVPGGQSTITLQNVPTGKYIAELHIISVSGVSGSYCRVISIDSANRTALVECGPDTRVQASYSITLKPVLSRDSTPVTTTTINIGSYVDAYTYTNKLSFNLNLWNTYMSTQNITGWRVALYDELNGDLIFEQNSSSVYSQRNPVHNEHFEISIPTVANGNRQFALNYYLYGTGSGCSGIDDIGNRGVATNVENAISGAYITQMNTMQVTQSQVVSNLATYDLQNKNITFTPIGQLHSLSWNYTTATITYTATIPVNTDVVPHFAYTLQDKFTYIKKDLCDMTDEGQSNHYNYVYEYKEWQTKPRLLRDLSNVLSSLTTISGKTNEFLTRYQNCCLYYNRYGNTIEGFTSLYSRGILSIWQVLNTYVLKVKTGADATTQFSATNQYYSTWFEIEYETTADCLYRASKQDYDGVDRVMIDNQTNSFVNSNNQGNLEYLKANRLGNPQLSVMARTDATGMSNYDIGNYYTDNGKKYIIYKTQYAFYKNHIDVNTNASENYVLQDYYTGVKSKIRSWINAKDEALIRNDIVKYYCEFSDRAKRDNLPLADYFVSPIVEGTTVDPIRRALLRVSLGRNIYAPASNKYYSMDAIMRKVGNSIVVSTGFEDNGFVGQIPNTDSSDEKFYVEEWRVQSSAANNIPPYYNVQSGQGGVPLTSSKYVNNDFECSNLQVMLAQPIDTASGTLLVDEDAKALMWKLMFRPIREEGTFNEVFSFNSSAFYIKDNKEIPKISLQIEFIGDCKDYLVGSKFVENQKMIARESHSYQFKYYSHPTIANAKEVPSDATQLTPSGNIQINNVQGYNNSKQIILPIAQHNGYTYMCDSNDNILIVIKGNTVYMNMRYSRNNNVYTYATDIVVAGRQ